MKDKHNTKSNLAEKVIITTPLNTTLTGVSWVSKQEIGVTDFQKENNAGLKRLFIGWRTTHFFENFIFVTKLVNSLTT